MQGFESVARERAGERKRRAASKGLTNIDGAPARNRNAVKHGLRSCRLPKGCSYIKQATDEMREVIEAEVADRHGGEVPFHLACFIQSAIRWERHALLAQRWLRIAVDDMNHEERLKYSREVARASSERDKCLSQLGLDTTGQQALVVEALYKDKKEEQQ